LALLVWSAPLTPPSGTPRKMQTPSGNPTLDNAPSDV
jgi:hypothetical protein